MKRGDDRNPGPKPLAGSAAKRIEAIVEGAERAAEKVIDDAEAQARAYVAEAEAEADRVVAERLGSLGELTDALVAQADAIRRQSELLTQSLREAKARLQGEDGGAAETPDASDRDGGEEAPRAPRLSAVDSVAPATEAAEARDDGVEAESTDSRRPSDERRISGRPFGSPAGARLLATQMAVSGSSREEIAARLRSGFEIEDTDAILDAILGPEA